jgi:hypothetical protein
MPKPMLPFAGKQRVFLRAADDEARDQMDNLHAPAFRKGASILAKIG